MEDSAHSQAGAGGRISHGPTLRGHRGSKPHTEEFGLQAWFDLRKTQSFPISPAGSQGQQTPGEKSWGGAHAGARVAQGSSTRSLLPATEKQSLGAPELLWDQRGISRPGSGKTYRDREGRGPSQPSCLPRQLQEGGSRRRMNKTDPREGCADPTGLQWEFLSLQSPGCSSTIPDFYKHNRLSFKGKSFHLCAMSP